VHLGGNALRQGNVITTPQLQLKKAAYQDSLLSMSFLNTLQAAQLNKKVKAENVRKRVSAF